MGSEAHHVAVTPAPLKVTRVPAFEDNYLWLIHGLGAVSHRVAAVDPGDAGAILAALERDQLELDCILVTHHHGDHVGGVAALVARFGVPVYGPMREDIPSLSARLHGGDTLTLTGLGLKFSVVDVPGHTAGHIAYHGHGALFCGDTLFSGGCGRLFEGTPAQMLASLDTLAALPDDTAVYCAHEYTASNLRFALAVEPDNAALAEYAADVTRLRARNESTIPSTIGRERAINPFLRTRLPTVTRAGHALETDEAAFAVVREWKNGFRG
jgi:hydroxyacylglutathione hydrolase